MKEAQNKGILLEYGTNELELVHFKIGSQHYGINVAKVIEIMMATKVNPIPESHVAVEGVFKPREEVITVVDLPLYLKNADVEHKGTDLFIVTHFNQTHMAFRVNSVVGISRVSWKDISQPSRMLSGGDDGLVTGITQVGDEMITILDFEKIMSRISPESSIRVEDVEARMKERPKNTFPILIAEDSGLLGELIKKSLEQAGYTHITKFDNGKALWDYLELVKKSGNLMNEVKMVITDIEMPQMDGHHLTKLIKDDPQLRSIPVVIFSSLINDAMHAKGERLGADAQLAKPQINQLIHIVDGLLGITND